MKKLPLQKRTVALFVVIVPLLALFIFVALRSGPLAPISVVLVNVENKSISPSLFGIGTVEARYTYKIGPTFAGRIKHLDVHVGDVVKSGQVLGEMDPVDLDKRIQAQDAAIQVANAQIKEAQARMGYAQSQAIRYKNLLKVHFISEEVVATKQHELLIAKAGQTAAHEELSRLRAEREALDALLTYLSLITPADGLIVLRDAEPGTTVVAGQAVVTLIDPSTLWLNVRFDQISAKGLAPELPAEISLRSQTGALLLGRVLRTEPLADAVTEEALAKVVFAEIPTPLPSIGELAEVTIILPMLPEMPVIPNAAVQHNDNKLGVWQVVNDDLRFTPVSLGAADLEGYVQVSEGLKIGDQLVVYSENALTEHSRIDVVSHLPGVK
jgi:RND family efflux transporter MFP subunit